MEAAASMASRFCITWFVSAAISSITRSDVPGLKATCPEMKSISPYITAWLYGPMGAGALGVLMISFVMVFYFTEYKYIFSQQPIFAKKIFMRIVIAATD